MMTSNKKLISRSLERKMLSCITEYEAIKNKTSNKFKTVKSFCLYHGFSHQNFMKIYRRWQQNPVLSSLLPQKRAPKFKSRRTDINVENEVIALRKLSLNRNEIVQFLRAKDIKISSSTVYNIFLRYGLNRLLHKNIKYKLSRNKNNRIFISRSGELVHIDLHYLSSSMLIHSKNRAYYLVGLIDGYSVWLKRRFS
jgi:hypothetical protein